MSTSLTLPWVRQVWRNIEIGWLVAATGFIALAVFWPQQLTPSLLFTLKSISGILLYLVIAVALTAYVKASDAENLIARVFKGHQATSIFIAALFGALSPFCSCGVVPVIAALLAMGTPFSAVLAFCLASPVMSPDAFVITAATLGYSMAIAKTVSAVALGLLGGFAAMMADRMGVIGEVARESVGDGGCSASRVREVRPVNWNILSSPQGRKTFATTFATTGLWLLKWLILAYFIESLMLEVVPPSAVSEVLGQNNPFAIPMAALIGIPMYLNGYAALPLVKGLIDLGTSPAVALTFLISGGVTSIPAAMAVLGVMRVRAFIVYLVVSLLGSVLLGGGYAIWLMMTP